MRDGVVLLHGIFRTRRSMQPLASFLEKQDFHTLNVSYPSTRHSIEALADIIHPQIDAFLHTVPGKLHFIGYSMGGLLARVYIHAHRPEKLGRVVLVGTPNLGSEVADKWLNVWLYQKLYGPAGQQLGTQQEPFVHLFGEVDYELASIAGNRSIDPLSSWMIGKPNDGKVSIDSTRIDGMKAHRVIAANHTFFPTSKEMWRLALEFLQTGEMA